MESEKIKVPEAVKHAKDTFNIIISTATIRNWIRDFGIGFKIGGRQYIYKDKLEEILRGNIHYEKQGRWRKSSED